MTDFMKYLEEHKAKALFKAQIYDLKDFLNDIDIYTQIRVGEGELNSLKTYIEECEKRLQCLKEYIALYENYLKERKGKNDSN